MLSFSRLIRSFQYAWRGIQSTFATEQNFRLQLVVGVLILAIGLLLRIPTTHVAVLVLVATFVLVLELVNTAWERTLDLIHPGLAPAVRSIKDILAAFVSIASLGAAITGIMLVGPPLLAWLRTFFSYA